MAPKAPPHDISAQPEKPEPQGETLRVEQSPDFADLLAQLRLTLLVSTYQAGKLVVLGTANSGLALSLHNFERAMGVAVHPRRIAVGAMRQVWLLPNAPAIAPKLNPPNTYDACFIVCSSHYTGEIQSHEMAWAGDELWVVNTLFSCLCVLHSEHNFVPRWRPPFVTALAGEDRCHLNGLAMEESQPRWVTALGQTNSAQAWRANKANGGCLIDVPSGEVVAGGLCMPHSPRVHQGRLWLLNSGRGTLDLLEPSAAKLQTIAALPGYTRGLAFHEQFAFVGFSKIRETSTFGGVPIAEQRDQLKCGVGVVDFSSGRLVAHVEFQSGINEIFDVQVLPKVRLAAVSGPYASVDGSKAIWMVPSASKNLTGG